MTDILILTASIIVLAILCWVALRKPKPTPEEDEHETMVRPRDKHGRWVKEGDGIVTPKGPNAAWNRKKGVRK